MKARPCTARHKAPWEQQKQGAHLRDRSRELGGDPQARSRHLSEGARQTHKWWPGPTKKPDHMAALWQ